MASTPDSKPKGKKLLIAAVCLGLVLLLFGIVWLGVIWPKMTMLPSHMDEHLWQQGIFQILDQQTGNFTTLEVKDDIHTVADQTLDGTLFVHFQHQFYSNSTGEKLPYAKEQILPLNRKTGLINPAMMQYPVGQAAAGYCFFPGGLKEGMTINLFNPGTETIRLAKFVRNDVFNFKGKQYDIVVMRQEYTDVPTHVPGFPEGLTITGYTDYFVEQKTGMTLDVYADESLSLPIQGYNVVVFKNQIWYDPSGTQDAIDNANKIKTLFPLMGTILPWLVIGIGLVLILAGSALHIRRRKQST